MGKKHNFNREAQINMYRDSIALSRKEANKKGMWGKVYETLGKTLTCAGVLTTVVKGGELVISVMNYDAVLELGVEPTPPGTELNAAIGVAAGIGASILGSTIWDIGSKLFEQKHRADNRTAFLQNKRNDLIREKRSEEIKKMPGYNYQGKVVDEQALENIRKENPVIEVKSAFGDADSNIPDCFKTSAFETIETKASLISDKAEDNTGDKSTDVDKQWLEDLKKTYGICSNNQNNAGSDLISEGGADTNVEFIPEE